MQRKIALFILFGMVFMLTACAQPLGGALRKAGLDEVITTAFLQQSHERQQEEIVFLLYETQVDHIEVNKEQPQALVWFALIDPETKEVNGTEPGLVLAALTGQNPEDPASWTMTFQHQPEWAEMVWKTDLGLLNAEEKQVFSAKAQVIPHAGQIFTGYKLPWEQGQRTKLSGSIAHVFIYKTCPDTCLYAFDFWTGDMFPVHAAKSGVVKFAKWDVPNGETTATNYLLVEDTSTDPTTYAIYYHLAYDSIPEDLRTPGAPVYQGQLIGNADDTGASTAHHLHFMVHSNPFSYWGNSVDIVFDEVAINDGRPRTCIEAENFPEYGDECVEGDWFYSDNEDNRPPQAWISSPAVNTTITTREVSVTAQAQDDVAVQTMSLFLRQGDAGWREVAEVQQQNTLAAEIDLCEPSLADGPFSLALEVVDSSGKITQTYETPHILNKAYNCNTPPPACLPAVHQIALYTEPNYQGACALVNQGLYYGMVYVPNIENDEVSSLLVGESTYTILYQDNNLKGNYETFVNDDPDLGDNVIGDNTTSSLAVYQLPAQPTPPLLPSSFSASEGEFIQISWSGDATEYYAELKQAGESLLTRDWSPDTTIDLGYLSTGEYTLTVTGRNLVGQAQNTMSFSITPPTAEQPESQLARLPNRSKSSTIEILWEVTAGESNIAAFELQARIDGTSWKNFLTNIPADQRSSVIVLQPGHQYDFRLRAIAIEGPDEEFPASLETSIFIANICVGDFFEPNNNMAEASTILAGETQLFLFCPTEDQDWVNVEITSTEPVQVHLDPLSNLLPITIDIFSPEGEITNSLSVQGETATIEIHAESDQIGIWQIRLSPYNPQVIGENTAYQIQIGEKSSENTLLIPLLCFTFAGIVLVGFLIFFLRNRRNTEVNP